MKTLLFCLISISLVLFSSISHSASSASINMGTLNYSITDLDLNDGISPYVIFLESGSEVRSFAYDTYLDNYQQNNNYNQFSISSTNVESITDLSNAVAKIQGDGHYDSMFSVEGYALGSGKDNSHSSGYQSTSSAFGWFTISANTEITFSTLVNANVSTTGVASDGIFREDAYAYGRLIAALYDEVFNSSDISQIQLYATSSSSNVDYYNYSSGSLSFELNISIKNLSEQNLNGYLDRIVDVRGVSYLNIKTPPEVPIPNSGWLFLSTLACFFSFKKFRYTPNHN